MTMTATRLKAQALAWLRYGKRLPIVCTEVGNWYADVLGLGRTSSVEVETKISKSDLRAEFKNKKGKHFIYQNSPEGGSFVPNYFYVLVPESLQEAALEIVGEGNPLAGVAAVTETGEVRILKAATKLHSKPPGPRITRAALLRMSSELTGLHATNETLRGQLFKRVDELIDGAMAATFKATMALDLEEPAVSLDLRARELALAVDKVSWETLDEAGKTRWREAAVRYLDIAAPSMEEWSDAAKSL